MKNNRRLSKLRRTDSLYIFASAFALLGGYAVLRSYAARNTSLLPPGTYVLSQYESESESGKVLDLSLDKSYQYCLNEYYGANNTAVKIVSEGENARSVSLRQTNANTACFEASSNYENATISLPESTNKPTKLIILK